MDRFLKYSLERISSLQLFYETFKDYVIKEATKGRCKNRFGYDLKWYFRFISNKDSKEYADEKFMKLQDRVLSNVEVLEDNEKEGYIFYRIKDPKKLLTAGYELNPDKAEVQFNYYSDMPRIHTSNTLVMLITRFEEFMSNFLMELYALYPEKYLDQQKICFSEIINKGVDDIRQKIVLREVDEKMRASYMDWFKLLQEHGMSFDSCANELDILREIYARRNIIIHNAGIVNETYVKAAPKSQLKEGDDAFINNEYLQTAFDTVKTIIYKIMIEAARIIKSDKIKYLDAIFEMAFSELLAENYTISTCVFNELMHAKMASTEIKTMSKVNRWIAEIELHGLESIKAEIEEFDTSIMDEIYVLAKELLLEYYELATKRINEMLKRETITVNMLEKWPMFKRYRDSSFYLDFKKSNQDFFKVSSFEINSSDTNPISEESQGTFDPPPKKDDSQVKFVERVLPQNEILAGVS